MKMKFDTKKLNSYIGHTSICCEKHPTEDLFIYGYYTDAITKRPHVWNSTTVHCRGLILDSNGNVIEHPFPKFWTFKQYLSQKMILLNENRVAAIPQGKFRITEKIDGTMTTLYWVKDTPYLATQRSFTNPRAIEATKILHSKYSHLFGNFDRNLTYIFEAIYPETKVLIDYGEQRDLYLIGIIDKKTGLPTPLKDIGFPMCKDYTSAYGHINNFHDLENLNLPNQEGFVLYFKNGFMLKIKFPWYKEAHHVFDKLISSDAEKFINYQRLRSIMRIPPTVITKNDVEKAIKSGDNDLITIRNLVPDEYYAMGFDYWLEKTKQSILDSKEQNPVPKTFDITERIKQPHIYETPIWKWEQRHLKIFKQ